jgi:arylsulfatase A-like enzyme
MKRLYKAEVEYQDHKIGELLNILKGAGRFENSWIIVTSDHGELFGEWGMVWHTASAHYQLLHVPMIVRPPGGRDGERLEMPVQPVDVFVTLLEETGTEVPAAVRRAYRLPLRRDERTPRNISVAQSHGASIAGLSMTQGMNMQADLAHWLTWTNSVYADGYLLETNSEGARALFDVISDPAMDLDQADLKPEKVETMMTALAGWQRSRGSHEGDGETQAHARLYSRDRGR